MALSKASILWEQSILTSEIKIVSRDSFHIICFKRLLCTTQLYGCLFRLWPNSPSKDRGITPVEKAQAKEKRR